MFMIVHEFVVFMTFFVFITVHEQPLSICCSRTTLQKFMNFSCTYLMNDSWTIHDLLLNSSWQFMNSTASAFKMSPWKVHTNSWSVQGCSSKKKVAWPPSILLFWIIFSFIFKFNLKRVDRRYIFWQLLQYHIYFIEIWTNSVSIDQEYG